MKDEKFEYEVKFTVIASDAHEAIEQVLNRLNNGGEPDSIKQVQGV